MAELDTTSPTAVLRNFVVSLGGSEDDLPGDYELRRSKRKVVDAHGRVWRRDGLVPTKAPVQGKDESVEDFAKRAESLKVHIRFIFREDEEVRVYALSVSDGALVYTLRGLEIDEDEMTAEAFREALISELVPDEEESASLDLDGLDLTEMDSDDLEDLLDIVREEMRAWNNDLKELRASLNAAKLGDKVVFNESIAESQTGLDEALAKYAAVARALRLAQARERVTETELPATVESMAPPTQVVESTNGAATA